MAESLREEAALRIKGLMPTIILDYVNNNEVVKLRDCGILVDQILPLIIKRVKGIKKPWKKLTFEQTIQAVIKELEGE